MHNTSALYRELMAGPHRFEVRLAIGERGRLITRQGEAITFGGVGILTAASGGDGGYGEDMLIRMETEGRVFPGENPAVGGCMAKEIRVEMRKPYGEVPRQARLVPYVRLTDGERHSEWIQKGVFYLDTRKYTKNSYGRDRLILTGYDDMLKAEQDFPAVDTGWEYKTDLQMVELVAGAMGIGLDSRTRAVMNRGYKIPYPGGFSCREVLGCIAGMYAGSFVISDLGELLLIRLNSLPRETRHLTDQAGYTITFGGEAIAV